MKNVILVAGAGGFIGGELVNYLRKNSQFKIRAVDRKPTSEWYQKFDDVENLTLDLQREDNCYIATNNAKEIYNLAADMGGMGFIESHKADCMLTVLINTHMLMAAKEAGVSRFFFSSSACVYSAMKQEVTNLQPLRESDAYPAMPEDGYGWEKLFSERMCRHFYEDFGLETRVARFHNVYGPMGTFDGGREKAPAALCRKLIIAKNSGEKKIDVWGDGEQTRSFMFIDDCIKGTKKIFESNCREVLNIGSEEQVSINQMIKIIEEIADYQVEKNYQLDKPKGVRGRSSNNDLVREKLNWDIEIKLKDGLEKTYKWIYDEITSGKNNDKFSKSSY
mgnify:CR=1 FL=1